MEENTNKDRDLLALFLKCSLYTTLVCILFAATGFGLVKASRYVSNQATRLEEYWNYKVYQGREYLAENLGLATHNVKVVDLEAPVEDRDTLINVYAEKFGISAIVMKPIFHQESNNNPYRWRYEEVWEKEYKTSFPCPSSYNPEECKMWFSSVGEAQISFPIWHEKCNVNHPLELASRKISYECSFTIISECLFEQLKNASPNDLQANARALRTCYRKYNGSGAKAEAYAEGRMASLANYTIEKEKLISVVKEMKEIEKNEKIENKKQEEIENNAIIETKKLEEERAKVDLELKNKIAMNKKK